MKWKANYEESCTCGDKLEKVRVQRMWRFITWKCPSCEKELAQTMISDSPVTDYYCAKALITRCNNKLREEKGLPKKKTVVTFYDDKGNRILWKDIVNKNKNWEKRMGFVNKKPF